MPNVARTLSSRRPPGASGEIDLRAVRQLVREVTAGVDPGSRLDVARAFCHQALSSYWWAKCAGAAELGGLSTYSLPLRALSEIEQRRAQRTGEAVAQLSNPAAAYLLSTLYTALLPEEMRSANGVFFTPPSLVDELLDLVEFAGIDWCRHTVLDPAAGGGAFVTPVAGRIAARLRLDGQDPGAILDHVATHVAGVEIDPFSAWMAQVFLEVMLWRECRAAGRRLPCLVVVADALTLPDGWRDGYDLLVGNPPYGRVTLEPATRARFARSLYGHANLYGLFTDLAVRLVRDGGVIGYVTPASFLGGQYFKELRAMLAAEAPPTAIDFIADRSGVFDKVLQETVLVVLRRGAERQPVSVRVAKPTTLSGACGIAPLGRHELPADRQAPWALPRSAADAALIAQLRRMPHRLADYGVAVSTGPLVWNRHRHQLATRRGRNRFPLIWAESVLSSGEFRFSWARRNHVPYFRWHEGQDHLLVRNPVVLVQRTTAKEQQRRLIAAELPADFLQEHGGAVVENHLNMVRSTNGPPRVPLRAIAALLNSDVVDQAFRCTNGSVAVSAYELESLPVPAPAALIELNALLDEGASAERVSRFLHCAYGLTDDTTA